MNKQELTPELAIVEFEAHLKKAEITPEVDITHLHALAAKAKALVDVDITDEAVMKEVATIRKELVTERRKIQADGKLARDEHTRINKAIKQVEDFLVGILGEDEERLKEYERQKKEMDIREERLATLPQRQLLLKGIGDGVEVSDDEILSMDDATFLNYVTERQSVKVQLEEYKEIARKEEAARKEAEAQRIKDAEDRARIEAEARVKAEADAKVKEANDKAQAELDAKEAEINKMKQEQADKAQAEADAEEARVKADAEAIANKANMEAQQKYQDWLSSNSYNPETDVIQDTGLDVVLYRKVAVYSKEI